MKAGVPAEKYVGKTSIIVYDAKSDPTRGDTDGDGIPDGKEGKPVDTAPWRKGLKDGIDGLNALPAHGRAQTLGVEDVAVDECPPARQ